MIVEVLGLIIAVGAMIIVIVRRQLQQNRVRTQTNLEESAAQVQLQLEDVADNVIKRIENRINHLELLIEEADEKINLLDEKIKLIGLKETIIPKQPLTVDQQTQSLADSSTGLQNLQTKPPLVTKRVFHESKTNQLVMKLLDSGHSMEDIAKKTGMGKGAILLIKEMHKS